MRAPWSVEYMTFFDEFIEAIMPDLNDDEEFVAIEDVSEYLLYDEEN